MQLGTCSVSPGTPLTGTIVSGSGGLIRRAPGNSPLPALAEPAGRREDEPERVPGVALAGFDALTASEGRQDIHHIPRTKRRTAVPQCDLVP